MRKILGLAIVAVAVLGGCGSDLLGQSCTSGGAAKAQVSSDSCTLAPGSATIQVTLCSDCLATSAGCLAEFRSDGSLELAPNYCISDSSTSTPSCPTDTNGCNAAVRQATCTVTIPSGGASTRPMTIVSANNDLIYGTLQISPSGSTSCTL